jgi:hypothetical protein
MEACIWVIETIGPAAYAAYDPLCPDAAPWQTEQKFHHVSTMSLRRCPCHAGPQTLGAQGSEITMRRAQITLADFSLGRAMSPSTV